eukprot:694510-Alexandrium_andersonii.AAC.1
MQHAFVILSFLRHFFFQRSICSGVRLFAFWMRERAAQGGASTTCRGLKRRMSSATLRKPVLVERSLSLIHI